MPNVINDIRQISKERKTARQDMQQTSFKIFNPLSLIQTKTNRSRVTSKQQLSTRNL